MTGDPGKQLQLQLLGGFRIEGDQMSGRGFESQKVRALLAYLARHEGQPFSREQLSEFLWPDEDSDAARHNLRQALYSLRRALGERSDDVITSDHRSLSLELAAGDSFDVRQMEAAYRRAFAPSGEVVPAGLARVAELYRGDFLAGFAVRDSAPFEDWLLTEQERLRDMAVQALSALVDHLSARGEYELAISHCHRLLEIDPLSEEAHHELIRHYLLSGRRPRAMRHYQELESLLDRELGVAPPARTRALYDSVGEDRPPPEAGRKTAERPSPSQPPIAPFIPLVGRDEPLLALERSWRAAIDEGCRLALVHGEAGIGKTRHARTLLDRLSSRHGTRVIQGRCTEPAPWCGGEPLVGVLRRLAISDGGASPAGPPTLPPPPAGPLEPLLVQALDRRFQDTGEPLALFLDDLHLASVATCETVLRLLERYAGRPLWILATAEVAGLAADHPLVRRLEDTVTVDRVRLDRLSDDDIGAICASLLPEGEPRRTLKLHLMVAGEGQPLATVESINALWDRGLLIPEGTGRWSLGGEPSPTVQATAEDLERLVLSRLAGLASSTGRLLSLAAVIGVTFDVGLLQQAAQEHIGVVEIGLESLLEHCLIRHYVPYWSRDPRERDLVLWAQGARRGRFEFAHPRIRKVVYDNLPADRQRVLHGEVAKGLELLQDPSEPEAPRSVAFHFLAAGRPGAALPYLRAAAESALERGQAATAAGLAERGLEAVDEAGGEPRPWEELLQRCRTVEAEEPDGG